LGLNRAWQAWQRGREERLARRHAIPDALWLATLGSLPFVARRSPEDLVRLRRLSSLFLATKEFHGAQGLQVTDAMALTVAVQACLPILHLGIAAYDDFVGIVLHPDEVLAPREHQDDDGVVHAFDEHLSGEAMAGGPVMLSWADVAMAGDPASSGYNVVLHEFAHVLDMADGVADGVPMLPGSGARQAWRQVLNADYARFCDAVALGEDTVLDPYGAEAPEEFFAVSVEAFFTLPSSLRQQHPALYRLLSDHFRQDPANFTAS
jgi:Mlc titration factor MtfA (ptsG expression regulator)